MVDTRSSSSSSSALHSSTAVPAAPHLTINLRCTVPSERLSSSSRKSGEQTIPITRPPALSSALSSARAFFPHLKSAPSNSLRLERLFAGADPVKVTDEMWTAFSLLPSEQGAVYQVVEVKEEEVKPKGENELADEEDEGRPRKRARVDAVHKGAPSLAAEGKKDQGVQTGEAILPEDLLRKVLAHIPFKQLKHCALVCRSFYTAAAPLLWHSLSFTFWDCGTYGTWFHLDESSTLLFQLLEESPHLFPLIQSLEVKIEELEGFSPMTTELQDFMAVLGMEHLWDEENNEFVNDREWEKRMSAEWGDKEGVLRDFLEHFDGLRRFTFRDWCWGTKDLALLALEILSDLPHLHTVEIDYNSHSPNSDDLLDLISDTTCQRAEERAGETSTPSASPSFPGLKELIVRRNQDRDYYDGPPLPLMELEGWKEIARRLKQRGGRVEVDEGEAGIEVSEGEDEEDEEEGGEEEDEEDGMIEG